MPEPRPLSAKLKRQLFFVLPFAPIGAILFVFGIVFVTVFGANTDFTSPFLLRDSDPVVEGTLLAKERTGQSVNKQKIHNYHYRYQVGSGIYEGHAFATNNGATPGDPVRVQYVAENPGMSRIEGMRRAPMGLHVFLIVSLFPLAGLFLLYLGLQRYRKNVHLVQHGVLTTGKVVRKVATSTRINQQTLYQVYFQFKSSDGRVHEACIDSLRPEILGDEANEPLVYDAMAPTNAVLLDSLLPRIRQQLTGQ